MPVLFGSVLDSNEKNVFICGSSDVRGRKLEISSDIMGRLFRFTPSLQTKFATVIKEKEAILQEYGAIQVKSRSSIFGLIQTRINCYDPPMSSFFSRSLKKFADMVDADKLYAVELPDFVLPLPDILTIIDSFDNIYFYTQEESFDKYINEYRRSG